MNNRKFSQKSLVYALILLFVVGCSPATTPTSIPSTFTPIPLTPTPIPPTALNVTLTGQEPYYDSSTYTVPARSEVTLTMTNPGSVAHAFTILKLGEHVTPPYKPADQDKILWELVVKAGETTSGTFTAPTERGEYDIICRIPGHLELGMKATLIVE
jgi:plastocyanin